MECDSEGSQKNDQTSSEAASQKMLMESYFQSQAVQSLSVKTGAPDTGDLQSTVISKTFKIPRKQSQQNETIKNDNCDEKTADLRDEQDENLQVETESPDISSKEEQSKLDTKGPESTSRKKMDKESGDDTPSLQNTLTDSPSSKPEEQPKPPSHTKDSETDETRRRKRSKSLKARSFPYEVCITDESNPYGTISKANANILKKELNKSLKSLILTPKVHIPQFLGTSLKDGKLIVTCVDFASMDFVNKTIKNIPLPWWNAELKVECRLRRGKMVSVTASENFSHVSELLAECKLDVRLSPEKWRLIAYEDNPGGKRFTLEIDMESFTILEDDKGVIRCGKTDFVFNLNPIVSQI